MSTGQNARTPTGLTPCAVIVDTRNVKGMLGDIFGGTSNRTTATGVIEAMRRYGFDPVETYAGIATDTSSGNASDKLLDMLQRNCGYRDDLTRAGVTVLEGYLAERSGEIEEKKVDVLLALQVADVVDRMEKGQSQAECIVVMSEDMDLMPAYEYAARRGVEVYAAANDTVYFREDQKKWLLIDEAAARAIAGHDHTKGSPIRRYLARVGLGLTPQGMPTKWKARWDQRPGEVSLFNNKGVHGNHYSTYALMRGEAEDLYPREIVFSEKAGLFPQVKLSDRPSPPGPLSGVAEAVVTAWVTPTKAKATFDDGSDCTVTVAPGSVLEGDKIAVLATHRRSGRAHYYIGPVDALSLPAGWPNQTAIAKVAITSDTNSAYFAARLSNGGEVQVHRKWLRHAGPNDRLVIALTGSDAASGQMRAMPLCCCLPG
jgi:hypothetical protein